MREPQLHPVHHHHHIDCCLEGGGGGLTHIVVVPACTIALDCCLSLALLTSGIVVPLGSVCSLLNMTLDHTNGCHSCCW